MHVATGCVVAVIFPLVLLAQQSQDQEPKPESDHEILLILHERTQRIQKAVDKADSTVSALEASIAELQTSQAKTIGKMDTSFTILIGLLGVFGPLLIGVLGWMGNKIHKHAEAIQKLNTLLERREVSESRAAGSSGASASAGLP